MRYCAVVIAAAAVCAFGCTGFRHRSTVGVIPAKSSNALVLGARDQLSWGTHYDPSYLRIPYPNGDVPRDRGVCTDVIIRAYRRVGYDLQKLVHEDMLKPDSGYPKYSGSSGPDTNIDHRRCPNLKRFLQRHGKTLSCKVGAKELTEWKPGDIVFWKLDNGRDHVGMVSDIKSPKGIPFVIHNIDTPAEEDCLSEWKIVGHFRYPRQGIEQALQGKKTGA